MDNGGAEARKGFNYQDAVISLVCIRKYDSSNFRIYVEANDDFEVLMDDDFHAYIQVKGEKKLSIKKLLEQRNGKKSILEKNFSYGDEKSKYKIVGFEFAQSQLERMAANLDEELFDKSLLLSVSQKEEVGNPKVERFSLVKTDFSKDLNVARKYLKGEMIEKQISIDGKDDAILDELFRVVSQKSEFKLKNDDEGNRERLKKIITSDDLNAILRKTETFVMFDQILNQFSMSMLKKSLIKKENFQIKVMYQEARKRATSFMKDNFDEKVNELTVITETMKIEELSTFEENARYAICISAYCNWVEDINV